MAPAGSPPGSHPDTVGAVIVAAGAGTRLPGAVPKPFLTLGGRSILDRTLGIFAGCEGVDRIVVVVAQEHVESTRRRVGGDAVAVVAGGPARRGSVAEGMRVLADVGWIVVHDGVRPFATPTLVRRVLEAARRTGAATAALPVTDTLKLVEGDRVLQTVDRSRLVAVQTPQAFRAGLLREAHARVPLSEPVTDDAELVERLGAYVAVVPGDPANMKITTRQDLEEAPQRLHAGEGTPLRIGVGYDVHRLAPDRALVLGGVTIPHPRGLDGHSDADVLTHAVMDAVLGAAGERDIGHHFPPDDPAYRGADSLRLLSVVMEGVRDAGWAVVNVDVVVIAETPRLAGHVDTMRARLAGVLGVEPRRVGIKATTGEGLGPIGRGEGIAAQAVALLRRAD
jgi:2-C-methyl-D-erythritol 4-phosphate cytidylyltransferase/2-C-methyl-D-erythritol 2,4-cyclodiphosphate synthase